MKIKIESAETGETFNMRMEESLWKLKQQLSMLVPIPAQDQILLYGPPYKILDPLYGPELSMKEGEKRIFVYDRRIFSDDSSSSRAKEPPRIRLLPAEVMKPELLASSWDSIAASPHAEAALRNIPQLLLEFERYFQQQLKRGHCYEVFVQESLSSSRQCVQQQRVQSDAMRAAVANLQIHHAATSAAFMNLEVKISTQQQRHQQLLENFETNLENLLSVPLHRSLRDVMQRYRSETTIADVATATAGTTTTVSASTAIGTAIGTATGIGIDRTGSSNSSSSSSGGAATAVTSGSTSSNSSTGSLYDCIAVDRERAYLQQCRENFRKVEESLYQVRTVHAQIQAGVDELQLPEVDFDRLAQLLDAVEHEHISQLDVMKKLRRDYQFVYDYITVLSSPPSPAEVVATDAITTTTTAATAAALIQQQQQQPSSSSVGDDNNYSSSSNMSALTVSASQRSELSTTVATAATTGVADSTAGVSIHADTAAVMNELQRRKNAQEGSHLIELMAQRVRAVKEAKNELEKSQIGLVRTVYSIMRQIAFLQTDIRHKLRRDIEWMKRLTSGRNEYFDHLAQIEKLPMVYNHLLNEIVRRRAYQSIFENAVVAASEGIAKLRAEETKQREKFIRSYGPLLPQIFFRLIPSLKEKPPYFHPTLTESQWLPLVLYEDVDRAQLTGAAEFAAAAGAVPAITSGTQYNKQPQQQQRQQQMEWEQRNSDESDKVPFPMDSFDTAISSTTMTSSQFEKALRAAHNQNSVTSTAVSQTSQQSLLTSTLAAAASQQQQQQQYFHYQQQQQHHQQYPQQQYENTSTAAADRSTALQAASVILPAVDSTSEDSRSGGHAAYEQLLEKYNKLSYENSQLLQMVADLKTQADSTKPVLKEDQQPSEDLGSSSVAVAMGAPALLPATDSAEVAAATTTTSTEVAVPSVNTLLQGFAHLNQLLSLNARAQKAAEAEAAADDSDTANFELPEHLISLINSSHEFRYPVSAASVASNKATTTAAAAVQSGDDPLEERQRERGNSISEFLDPALVDPLTTTTAITTNAAAEAVTETAVVSDITANVFRRTALLARALQHTLKTPKISFVSFHAGDIALFIPAVVNNRKIWMAFSAGAPYRYLADQSLASFLTRSKRGEERAYILGRIVLIDVHVVPDSPAAAAAVATNPNTSVAGAKAAATSSSSSPTTTVMSASSSHLSSPSNSSSGSNPYGLPVGTEYYICYLEALKTLKGASGRAAAAGTATAGSATAITSSI